MFIASSRLNHKINDTPAPEEPVTGLCLICHEKQTTCSSGLCEECKEPEEPVSKDISHAFKDGVKATLTGENNEVAKWFKEPTPDWRELRQDEVICEGDERTDRHHELGWRKAENSIGTLAWKWPTLKFRTRRPLPKQEEMPLENDIASIEWSCGHTARAIRYLRDEIQKLKEER
jgi:hypothetical protein